MDFQLNSNPAFLIVFLRSLDMPRLLNMKSGDGNKIYTNIIVHTFDCIVIIDLRSLKDCVILICSVAAHFQSVIVTAYQTEGNELLLG